MIPSVTAQAPSQARSPRSYSVRRNISGTRIATAAAPIPMGRRRLRWSRRALLRALLCQPPRSRYCGAAWPCRRASRSSAVAGGVLPEDARLAGLVLIGRQYADFPEAQVFAHLVAQVLGFRSSAGTGRQTDVRRQLREERAGGAESSEAASELQQSGNPVGAGESHGLGGLVAARHGGAHRRSSEPDGERQRLL